MSFKIIADSCCDLPGMQRNTLGVTMVPLKITLDAATYVDNGSVSPSVLLREMAACKLSPKTACPSPSEYLDYMEGEEDVFVVTLSSKLSGSHQSAMAAAQMKEHGGRVHVFDSKSASAGESAIVYKLLDLIGQGLTFGEIIVKTEAYIAGLKTFFVLDSLENLIKAGRIARLAGQVASILHMRPIMGDDGAGGIMLLEKARGTKNAMAKLADVAVLRAEYLRERGAVRDSMVISHCNCFERAVELRQTLSRRVPGLKMIHLLPTGGLSTTYAGDGGIIIGY